MLKYKAALVRLIKYNFKIILLLSILICKLNLYAQELLPNGNFEDATGIPQKWGESDLLQHWSSFSNGKWSPVTYFDDKGYMPSWKEGGKESPYSGHGFIGLGIAFKDVERIGNQFVETELISPLEKDSIYIISAYVSLADKVEYALNYIPASLSDKHQLKNDGNPTLTFNLIKLKSDEEYLENKTGWVKISAIYKARGGEHFFVIGGIEGNKKLEPGFKIKKVPFQLSFQYLFLRKLTYYFIDYVSIHKQYASKIAYRPIISSMDLVHPKEIKERNKIVLNDLTFEVNSYILRDSVNEQLNNLFSELLNCKTCHIKITGYTDNIGTEKSNIKLSIMRAKTIYEYLHAKGIFYERMEYEGLGESNPIANNNLSEGRLKNRRVEIQIIE